MYGSQVAVASSLPLTGLALGWMAMTAVMLLFVGAALRQLTRRRKSPRP